MTAIAAALRAHSESAQLFMRSVSWLNYINTGMRAFSSEQRQVCQSVQPRFWTCVSCVEVLCRVMLCAVLFVAIRHGCLPVFRGCASVCKHSPAKGRDPVPHCDSGVLEAGMPIHSVALYS